MNFRNAEALHVPQIFKLQHNLFEKPYAYTEDYILELTKSNKIIIATLCIHKVEIVVGFVMFSEKKHENLDRQVFTILCIGVDKEMRNKGIGTKLLEMLREISPRWYLHVKISNTAAVSVYTKAGFKILRVLKNYYSQADDAYYMMYVTS